MIQLGRGMIQLGRGTRVASYLSGVNFINMCLRRAFMPADPKELKAALVDCLF